MASKFITYTAHGEAESSGITSTYCGHLYHLKAMADIDNGSFSAFDVTKYAGNTTIDGEEDIDVWETVIPAKTDSVSLILTVPLIYDTTYPKMQEESNFYNAQGDICRSYELHATDRFAVSAAALNGTAAVGKYIAMDGTSYKATVYDTAPTDTKFVGYIYTKASNGKYRVIVKQN